jgi:hypothetical protein
MKAGADIVLAKGVAAEIPAGVSPRMLHELHLLTRVRALNADARRKLKQIRHLVHLIEPALADALARHPDPIVVDCGAGKSYLGFLLYEMVLAAAGKGTVLAIEARPELSAAAAERATRFGYDRLRFVPGAIDAAALPERVHVVTALHACDTATDDALALAITRGADHVAVVPCCQAELARQLDPARIGPARAPDAGTAELYRHAHHRREFGSHLTNVIRATTLEALGYQVTVTELVGWEHTMKNELILGRRVHRFSAPARARLRELLDRFPVDCALHRMLRERGCDPFTS